MDYIVFQCAGEKRHLEDEMHAINQDVVTFVAQPMQAPQAHGIAYFRPDDPIAPAAQISWRDRVIAENAVVPLPGYLCPAYNLYMNARYGQLFHHYGERLYILSAGWGLVRASYNLPTYDITFSYIPPPNGFKRRRYPCRNFHPEDVYSDFTHLNDLNLTEEDDVWFIGGKNYIEAFCDLTIDIQADKHIYYWAGADPANPDPYDGDLPGAGFFTKAFFWPTPNQWHYACALRIMNERSPYYIP